MGDRKVISRIGYAILYIVIICIAVVAIANTFYYFKSGAEINLFNEDMAIESAGNISSFWDDNDSTHELSYKEKEKIGQDMSEAFQAMGRAMTTNQSDGLEDFFSHELVDKMTSWIDYNKSISLRDQQVFLDHKWKINYINKDRTFIQLTDKQCVSYHKVELEEKVQDTHLDTCAYDITLWWDQNRWKPRYLTKIENTVKESQVLAPVVIHDIKIGINYVQKKDPWLGFVKHLEGEDYKEELENITKLGIETIRVFINYHDYGKEYVPIDQLQSLVRFLNTCHESGIQTVITLFDFYGDYRLQDWGYTAAHARQIVDYLKDHPSIIAWDIKNEADLDFEHRGEQQVKDWLSYMIDHIKDLDPLHPVTIGWSSVDRVGVLEDKLDIISFHYYESVDVLGQKLQEIKTHKPIWISEIGTPSYEGIWNATGDTFNQVDYLSKTIETCEKENVKAFIWTLNDFEEVPKSVFGRKPWIKAKQRNFGLIGIDGQLKPSGILIQELSSKM